MPIDLSVRSLNHHKVRLLLDREKSYPSASNYIYLRTVFAKQKTELEEQAEFNELLPLSSAAPADSLYQTAAYDTIYA